jgi:hypothetical protein
MSGKNTDAKSGKVNFDIDLGERNQFGLTEGTIGSDTIPQTSQDRPRCYSAAIYLRTIYGVAGPSQISSAQIVL